ncbi:hypothetical protein AVEN_172396-1, partial [Araneus ventricosus]
ICSPECMHGGRCIGHNSCLCPKEYRGSRCEYPLSNCEGHDRFASVGYKCMMTDKETVCNVSCSSTGMALQPPEPITYICSLDGTWHPDLKPICVSEIYGENVVTDGMVRKWVRQINDGRTNGHDEARSGRPFVVNDGLVSKVNEKIRENRRFTIRMLCDEFPQILTTVLRKNVTNRLNYRKR